MTDPRRALPSVDKLLRLPALASLAADAGRDPLVAAIRTAISDVRAGSAEAPPAESGWIALVRRHLDAARVPTLRRVVNATGVVLHTNLGRAPLADAAIDAVTDAARAYGTLEYDVEKGARGSRHVHCAALLAELTGAADAMVVNNAASALMLVLAAAAEGGRTVVSRGELIEIGGGFRIPEIMERGGTTLVEVGTTNRTRLSDYAKALAKRDGPRAILKVHRSNFRLEGFTAEAALEELVSLGRKARVPVLYDLGSGLMQDPGVPGLEGEPTLPASARAGATAVVASGDKLLGGPQAGIIVGTAKFLAACRAHPLARAARADKLTLAALAATLQLYRDPARAREAIPVLRMLAAPLARLDDTAQRLLAALPSAARAEVVNTKAAVGGGAFPGVELDSRGVALDPGSTSATALAARLRAGAVPVVAIVQKGRVVLDVRALLSGDIEVIAAAVRDALA